MVKGGNGKGNGQVVVTGTDDVDALAAALDTTKINGGDGDDQIVGGDQVDDIRAGDGDGFITGGAGDDTIFGNDGYDTAVFADSILDNWNGTTGTWVEGKGNSWEVTTSEGTDTLKHIEALEFSDYTLKIDGANNIVYAQDDAASTDENASRTADVLNNDKDFDGDSLSVVAVSGGGAGSVSFDAGTVSFDPGSAYDHLQLGASVQETITYTVSDGNGGDVTADLVVTITGSNDAPVVSAPISASTDEDAGGLSVDLLAGATDVDDDAILSASNVSLSGDTAGASVNGNSLDIDTAAYNNLALGATATIEVTYDVVDEHGASVA